MKNELHLAVLLAVTMTTGCASEEGSTDSGSVIDQGATPDGLAPRDDAQVASDTGGAKKASYEEVTSFGGNPGDLRMFRYLPANHPGKPALVLALHGCGETAEGHAQQSGWTTLADRRGFLLVFPEQPSANNIGQCFNWFAPGDTTRGSGEVLSLKQMVDWMIKEHDVDLDRVFVTGLSAGGAMAVALMAAYPEVIAGGAPMAGIAFGCGTDLMSGNACLNGVDKTAKAWGDLVRKAASPPPGGYPRVILFQGDADSMVSPSNLDELVEQWTEVHGADQQPDATDVVAGHTRKRFEDAKGTVVVESYLIKGMGHGVAVDPGSGPNQGGKAGGFYHDVGLWSCLHAADFWKL